MTDWDLLYAQLVTATGWDWDRIDALTIPRYRALLRYWRDYPPAHLLLRALLGIRQRKMPTEPVANFATLASLAPTGTLNIATLNRM